MKKLLDSYVILFTLLVIKSHAIPPRSDCVPQEETERLIDGMLHKLWQCLSLQYEPISVTVNQDRNTLNGDLEENILVQYYEFHASFGPFVRVEDIVSIKCYDNHINIKVMATTQGFGASLKFNSAQLNDEPLYFGTHFIKENLLPFSISLSQERTPGSCLIVNEVKVINFNSPLHSELNITSDSFTSCKDCPQVFLMTISADINTIRDKLFHSISLAVKHCVSNILKSSSLPKNNYGIRN